MSLKLKRKILSLQWYAFTFGLKSLLIWLSIDTAIAAACNNSVYSKKWIPELSCFICVTRERVTKETQDDNNCRTRQEKSRFCLRSSSLVREARKPHDIVKVPDRATTVPGVSVDQAWKSGRNGIKKNGKTRCRVCSMAGGRLDKLGFSRLRCR